MLSSKLHRSNFFFGETFLAVFSPSSQGSFAEIDPSGSQTSLFPILLFLDLKTDSMIPIMLPLLSREKYYSDFYRNQLKLVLLKFPVNTFLSMFGAGFISILTSTAGLESSSWKKMAILKNYHNLI